MLSQYPDYDELADRYDFGRPVIERLAQSGIIVGGKTGRRGRWLSTDNFVLHVLENRQAPLNGAARDAALRKPLTTEALMERLGRSADTVRDMLKNGDIRGWRLQIPKHLEPIAGKRVCERWYVDAESFEDYRRKAIEEALRRRFGAPVSDWDFPASGVGLS